MNPPSCAWPRWAFGPDCGSSTPARPRAARHAPSLKASPGSGLLPWIYRNARTAFGRIFGESGLRRKFGQGGLEELADWGEWDPWDCILLDVPCSGTGVIRRHPDIRHRRQPGDLERFATQQQHLLETAWELLVPGGTLLYVTCSIMPRENDGVIDGFLRRHTSALG